MAKKVLIGLDKFYYSLLTTDTTAELTYQTPVALKGAVSVAINTNSEVATLFADDGPYDTAETIGEIEVDVTIADISQEDYAALMGHTITAGVMIESATDQPVDTAFGFRAKRSNGGYSYVWLYKGKFSKPEMSHETKGDSINFQTPTFKGKFVQTVYNGRYKQSTRTDATDYTTAIATAWFDAVYGVTAETTAPTFSSSTPTAGGTIAGTSNLTVTFSEPILSSTAIAANFTLILATASTTVAITSVSVSSATVTLGHDAMTAGSTYNLIIGTGIKDEVGNAMTGTYTVRFTAS